MYANISAIEKQNMLHLMPYLDREGVTDLHMNKPEEIFLKLSCGKVEKYNDHSLNYEWLCGMAHIFATYSGQEFDTYNNPIVGFKLPGGHRVQIIAGLVTESAFSMAIRVKSSACYSLDSYGLLEQDLEALVSAVKCKRTILVSGGTSSGKTSFLNSLIKLVDPLDRIITVEDVRELEVVNDNFIPFVIQEMELM